MVLLESIVIAAAIIFIVVVLWKWLLPPLISSLPAGGELDNEPFFDAIAEERLNLNRTPTSTAEWEEALRPDPMGEWVQVHNSVPAHPPIENRLPRNIRLKREE